MSEALTTLNGTLEVVWHMLERGAVDKTAPANLPVLATASREHGAKARIVVLRSTDRATQKLTFFTHALSGKVSDLNEDERAEVLVWCAAQQFQIRISAKIGIAAVDENTWRNLGPGTRLNYATDPSPGIPLHRPEEALQATPDAGSMLSLEAFITKIDTLWISPEGLRRATFEDGRSQWIAP